MTKKQKKWVWGGIFILMSLGVIEWRFPLEIQEMFLRWQLWRQNVSVIQREGWSGYWLDRCQLNSSQDCSCVVLVHGLSDSALTWKNLLLWPEQGWRQMGLNHPLKLLAVDLPGSGRTPRVQPRVQMDSEYRVRKQAEKLHQVLAPLCSEWVVVGNGLGGWIGAWLALDWPEGVRRLILVDSAGLRAGMQKDFDLLVESTETSMREFQKRAYFRPKELSNRQWESLVDHEKATPAQQIVAAQTQEDVLDTKLSSLLRPVLLIWGKEDRVIPLSEGKQMRSLLPGAVWREIPECGHFPQKECPLPLMQGIVDMIHYGSM